jgi:hypothetical protein
VAKIEKRRQASAVSGQPSGDRGQEIGDRRCGLTPYPLFLSPYFLLSEAIRHAQVYQLSDFIISGRTWQIRVEISRFRIPEISFNRHAANG